MSDFPWTPHTATWQPKKDSRRGGAANDGKADSLVPGSEILCFIEEKSARWAAEKYGVEVERTPFLFIALPAVCQGFQMGDVLTFRGEPLEVAFAPTVYDFGDGYVSAETMLTGKKTGGRIL